MRRGVFFAALMMATGLAFAKDSRLDLEGGSGFADQHAKVLAELADGETYSEITAPDRAAVVRDLEKMDTLLAGRPVSALGEAEKVELMNLQSSINTTLTRASEDSRMICRREPAVGSRLQRSQCLTVAERRRQREGSQDAIDAHNRGFRPPPGAEP